MSTMDKVKLFGVVGLIVFCLVMAVIKGQIPGMTGGGAAVLEQGTLTGARAGFKTVLERRHSSKDPVVPAQPPFGEVKYPSSGVGSLSAYVTNDPGDGKRHPAIIWITGGDCNSIGDVWSPAPAASEQSASAYRNAGIVMMFPSLRGGNKNPGSQESFMGEVDDVRAARRYLAKLPYVDRSRIYLGGHSTGGTLALLVSECTSEFRAVFSFGPVSRVSDYSGGLALHFDVKNEQETKLRSPIYWLNSIRSPTFVIEGGSGGRGNLGALEEMSGLGPTSPVRFLSSTRYDHFSVLSAANGLIAKKILKDRGSVCNISISQQEITDM